MSSCVLLDPQERLVEMEAVGDGFYHAASRGVHPVHAIFIAWTMKKTAPTRPHVANRKGCMAPAN